MRTHLCHLVMLVIEARKLTGLPIFLPLFDFDEARDTALLATYTPNMQQWPDVLRKTGFCVSFTSPEEIVAEFYKKTQARKVLDDSCAGLLLLLGVDFERDGLAARFGTFINQKAKQLFEGFRIDYLPGSRIARFLSDELKRKKHQKRYPEVGEFMKVPTFTKTINYKLKRLNYPLSPVIHRPGQIKGYEYLSIQKDQRQTMDERLLMVHGICNDIAQTELKLRKQKLDQSHIRKQDISSSVRPVVKD